MTSNLLELGQVLNLRAGPEFNHTTTMHQYKQHLKHVNTYLPQCKTMYLYYRSANRANMVEYSQLYHHHNQILNMERSGPSQSTLSRTRNFAVSSEIPASMPPRKAVVSILPDLDSDQSCGLALWPGTSEIQCHLRQLTTQSTKPHAKPSIHCASPHHLSTDSQASTFQSDTARSHLCKTNKLDIFLIPADLPALLPLTYNL